MELQYANLTPERYEVAKTAAKKQILDRNPEPMPKDFEHRSFSKYPVWMMNLVIVGLIAVIMVGFYISSAKFIIGADQVIGSVVHSSDRLSGFYLDSSIVLALIFGELGTILFSLSSAIFEDKDVVLLGLRFRPAVAIFRIASVISALIALSANIGISVLHVQVWQSISLFGWLLTIVPPLSILACSLILEKLFLGIIENRAKARAEYTTAHMEWVKTSGDPELHPDYIGCLATQILEQLVRVSQKNKRIIEQAIEENPLIRIDIAKAEIARHEWVRLMKSEAFLMEPTVS